MRALVNGHFFRTRTRDSTTVARRHARAARVAIATSAGRRSIVPGITDPTIQRIESFQCRRGSLSAERRNRGYTLYRCQRRHAGRAAAPDRAERSGRGALLVTLEGTMDQRRPTRTHRPTTRRRTAPHRFR